MPGQGSQSQPWLSHWPVVRAWAAYPHCHPPPWGSRIQHVKSGEWKLKMCRVSAGSAVLCGVMMDLTATWANLVSLLGAAQNPGCFPADGPTPHISRKCSSWPVSRVLITTLSTGTGSHAHVAYKTLSDHLPFRLGARQRACLPCTPARCILPPHFSSKHKYQLLLFCFCQTG